MIDRSGAITSAVLVIAASGLTALLCVLMGYLAVMSLSGLDIYLYRWLAANYVAHSPMTTAISTFTQLGDPLPMLIQACVAGMVFAGLVKKQRWLPLLIFPAAMASEWCVQKVVEYVVGRSSPSPGGGTWPSGGTARFVLIYGLAFVFLHLMRRPGRLGVWISVSVVTILTAAEAYTRLYLLKHWPTDIAGGLIIGGLLLATFCVAIHQMAQSDSH